MLKKVMFGLVISSACLVSSYSADAMDKETIPQSKPLSRSLPKPDLNPDETLVLTCSWTPQAPVKEGPLLEFWRQVATWNPLVRVTGNTIEFFQ